MIMDAQDIMELIEYFRNLQDNEMKFEIEELRGYIAYDGKMVRV